MDTKSSTNGNFSQIPIEALAFETLSAMDDEAMVEVYRLLVKLGQRDAATLLAEFIRRIAGLDASSGQQISS